MTWNDEGICPRVFLVRLRRLLTGVGLRLGLGQEQVFWKVEFARSSSSVSVSSMRTSAAWNCSNKGANLQILLVSRLSVELRTLTRDIRVQTIFLPKVALTNRNLKGPYEV